MMLMARHQGLHNPLQMRLRRRKKPPAIGRRVALYIEIATLFPFVIVMNLLPPLLSGGFSNAKRRFIMQARVKILMSSLLFFGAVGMASADNAATAEVYSQIDRIIKEADEKISAVSAVAKKATQDIKVAQELETAKYGAPENCGTPPLLPCAPKENKAGLDYKLSDSFKLANSAVDVDSAKPQRQLSDSTADNSKDCDAVFISTLINDKVLNGYNKYLHEFSNKQTGMPDDAKSMVESYLASHGVQTFSCKKPYCNPMPGSEDYVECSLTCFGRNYDVNFNFDDVCDRSLRKK
jgi:hypothetical protein